MTQAPGGIDDPGDVLMLAIARLELRPEDILVVRSQGPLSQAAAARLEAYLRERLPDTVELLVLDNNIDLAVFGPAPIEKALPAIHLNDVMETYDAAWKKTEADQQKEIGRQPRQANAE